jgi:hypothetical protein
LATLGLNLLVRFDPVVLKGSDVPLRSDQPATSPLIARLVLGSCGGLNVANDDCANFLPIVALAAKILT